MSQVASEVVQDDGAILLAAIRAINAGEHDIVIPKSKTSAWLEACLVRDWESDVVMEEGNLIRFMVRTSVDAAQKA